MTPQDKLGQKQEVSIDEWEDMVRERYQVPRNLWKAMSTQESGGNWDAVSPTGVKGKWQVTEATAKQYGLDRNDPYQQVVAAAKYLRDQYEGLKDVPDDNARWLGAVGRYYGGPGAVGGDGSISTKSPDGVSTPDKHIERVAKLWGQFEKGGEAPAPTDFSGKPVTPQPVKQQQEVKFQSPRPPVTAKRGPIRDVKPLGFGGDPTQQMMQDVAARSKQVKAVPRQPTDFEKRSPLGQAGEILTTGILHQGVEGLYKGLSYLNPLPSPYKGKGLLTPQAEQAMQQQEAAQDQAYPAAAPVARGLAGATVQAPAYMLGGAGGMGAGMLTAAGLSAAQEDWSKDPVRSAVRVGINATLPFAASRGANALIRPVTAPGVAATEAIAGAAGNVVPEGIEQMAFEGKLDPQRLAQTGLIGALSPLNVTGAGRQADANKLSRIQKATGSATTAPVGESPALTPDQAFGPDNFDPATTAPPPVDPQRPIQSRMQAIGTETPTNSGRYIPTPEVQKGVEVADKARTQAESARANQDTAAEVRSLEGERQAIKAAMRGVGMKDAVGRRALGERLAGIEQDIAKAKANARQSGRSAPEQRPVPETVAPEAARDIADDPTADLTGDLAPLPEQTAPLTEDLVQPTGALPEQATADPRSGVATIYGRRAGTPLPPRVGEPAPKRITKEIPRERTSAQESIRTAIDSAKARRMPPPPPKQAGVRPEVLGQKQLEQSGMPIDPTTGQGQTLMYGARPHHQKRLNEQGRAIVAEQQQKVLETAGEADPRYQLAEGDFKGNNYVKLGTDAAGKTAQHLFRTNTKKSIEGVSEKGGLGEDLAFFLDPHVQGALGLTKDATSKDAKAALNRELAAIMNIRDPQGKIPEISLRSVPEDVWRMWARRKELPASAMARFNKAVRVARGEITNDTTPPAAPDAAIPQRREAPMRSAQASDTGRPVARAAAETPAAPRPEPVAPAPARVAERAVEQPVARAEQPAARASEPVAATPKTPAAGETPPRAVSAETAAPIPAAEAPAARKAAPRKAASPAKTAPKVNEKTLTDAGWQKKSPADYRHPDGRRISRNERNRWEITRESGEGTQTFDTLRDAIVAATGEPAAKPAKPVKPSPMADDVLIKPQPEMPEDAMPLPPTNKPFNMPDPEPQPKRAAKAAEQPARVEQAKARRAAKPKAEAKPAPEVVKPTQQEQPVKRLSQVEFNQFRDTRNHKEGAYVKLRTDDGERTLYLTRDTRMPTASYILYESQADAMAGRNKIHTTKNSDIKPALMEIESLLNRQQGTPEPRVIEEIGTGLQSVEKQVAKEKPLKATGFTRTQAKWLGDKIQEALPSLDEAGTRVKFKVPGDGEFTVDTPRQANRLHKKATGEYIEGAPRPDFKETEATTQPEAAPQQPATADLRSAAKDLKARSPFKKQPKFVEEAEARLRDAASGKLAGSGAQAIADQAIVTGYKVYKQGMAFSDWTRSMLREFGAKVRPYLRDTWAKLTAAAKEFYGDQEGSAPASPGPPRRNRVTAAVRENAAKEPPRRSPYADLLQQINQDQLRQQQPAPKAGAKLTPEQKQARKESRKEAAEANKGKDAGAYRSLRSPLSNLNYIGTYESLGGEAGKQVSEAIRQYQVDAAHKRVDVDDATKALRSQVKPYIDQIKDDGLPGLATMMERHIQTLSGDSSVWDDLARKAKSFQYNTKLRLNPRSTMIQLLQPMQTLWPHVSTGDMLSIYKRLVTDKNLRLAIHDIAVRESGSKIEGLDAPTATEKGRMGKLWEQADLFGKGSTVNRMVGHIAGEMIADRQGLTGEAKQRYAADWAKKVEFDNSRFDIPPAFSGPVAGTALQFKPFLVKNLERLWADTVRGVEGVSTRGLVGGKKGLPVFNGRTARVAKTLISQMAIGGVRSIVPGFFHAKVAGGALILGLLASKLESQWPEELGGKEGAHKLAEALYFGLPGLFGADFSGSVGIIDEPFGRSTIEKIANFFLGPTIGTISDLLDAGGTAMEGEYKKAAQKGTKAVFGPYYKTGESLYDMATGDRPVFKAGRAEVPLTPMESANKLFMMTPTRQTRYYDMTEVPDTVKENVASPEPLRSNPYSAAEMGINKLQGRSNAPLPMPATDSSTTRKPARRRASRRRTTRRESIG